MTRQRILESTSCQCRRPRRQKYYMVLLVAMLHHVVFDDNIKTTGASAYVIQDLPVSTSHVVNLPFNRRSRRMHPHGISHTFENLTRLRYQGYQNDGDDGTSDIPKMEALFTDPEYLIRMNKMLAEQDPTWYRDYVISPLGKEFVESSFLKKLGRQSAKEMNSSPIMGPAEALSSSEKDEIDKKVMNDERDEMKMMDESIKLKENVLDQEEKVSDPPTIAVTGPTTTISAPKTTSSSTVPLPTPTAKATAGSSTTLIPPMNTFDVVMERTTTDEGHNASTGEPDGPGSSTTPIPPAKTFDGLMELPVTKEGISASTDVSDTAPVNAPAIKQQAEETDVENIRMVVYRGYNQKIQSVPLSNLTEQLGYRLDEVTSLQAEAMSVIVEDNIPRPRGGVPMQWKVSSSSTTRNVRGKQPQPIPQVYITNSRSEMTQLVQQLEQQERAPPKSNSSFSSSQPEATVPRRPPQPRSMPDDKRTRSDGGSNTIGSRNQNVEETEPAETGSSYQTPNDPTSRQEQPMSRRSAKRGPTSSISRQASQRDGVRGFPPRDEGGRPPLATKDPNRRPRRSPPDLPADSQDRPRDTVRANDEEEQGAAVGANETVGSDGSSERRMRSKSTVGADEAEGYTSPRRLSRDERGRFSADGISPGKRGPPPPRRRTRDDEPHLGRRQDRRDKNYRQIDNSRKRIYNVRGEGRNTAIGTNRLAIPGPSRKKQQQQRRRNPDDPPPNWFWPDIDTFQDMLQNEANFRLRIIGRDWAPTMKQESEWRLAAYKNWLWKLHNGIGSDMIVPPGRYERARRMDEQRQRAQDRQRYDEEREDRRRQQQSRRRPRS